ncbi:hypothetical protein GGI42DRAFT_205818 [Trichoderma sp. SZMC 28013]
MQPVACGAELSVIQTRRFGRRQTRHCPSTVEPSDYYDECFVSICSWMLLGVKAVLVVPLQRISTITLRQVHLMQASQGDHPSTSDRPGTIAIDMQFSSPRPGSSTDRRGWRTAHKAEDLTKRIPTCSTKVAGRRYVDKEGIKLLLFDANVPRRRL